MKCKNRNCDNDQCARCDLYNGECWRCWQYHKVGKEYVMKIPDNTDKKGRYIPLARRKK